MSSAQISTFMVIALMLCSSFASYSSFELSGVDIGNGLDIQKSSSDENNRHYRLPLVPSLASNRHRNGEYSMLNKNDFRDLLLRSALVQAGNHPSRSNEVHVGSRRHVPQTFHAMRG